MTGMFKPEQIQYSVTDRGAAETKEIERLFDTAITASATSGEWPAFVPEARFSTESVRFVIQKYRDAGWFINTSRQCMAIIEHPKSMSTTKTDAEKAYDAEIKPIADSTWRAGILHLTVDGDGLVSLWDAPRGETSYLKLALTAAQIQAIEDTRAKGGYTP